MSSLKLPPGRQHYYVQNTRSVDSWFKVTIELLIFKTVLDSLLSYTSKGEQLQRLCLQSV